MQLCTIRKRQNELKHNFKNYANCRDFGSSSRAASSRNRSPVPSLVADRPGATDSIKMMEMVLSVNYFSPYVATHKTASANEFRLLASEKVLNFGVCVGVFAPQYNHPQEP
jgi:hypothetical protein